MNVLMQARVSTTHTLHLGILFLVVIGTACGASKPPTQSTPTKITAAILYPLRLGSVWSYDVDTGVGLNTLAISRVVGVHGTRAEVGAGSTPVAYEVTNAGIWRADGTGWLLRNPIVRGATWQSPIGRAKVLSMWRSIDTPAGRFAHCTQVRETSADLSRRVDTIYCPTVGPVFIDSQMEMKISGQSTRVTARLLGFDFSK
ncbi:MAG: hypothetical protein H6715_00040 [Myxococcales bacterium]|nr:hypothetical protein [Myxococcales bacterium]MCB9707354.1 hypothetical protein [Myxococcales bacterium]